MPCAIGYKKVVFALFFAMIFCTTYAQTDSSKRKDIKHTFLLNLGAGNSDYYFGFYGSFTYGIGVKKNSLQLKGSSFVEFVLFGGEEQWIKAFDLMYNRKLLDRKFGAAVGGGVSYMKQKIEIGNIARRYDLSAQGSNFYDHITFYNWGIPVDLFLYYRLEDLRLGAKGYYNYNKANSFHAISLSISYTL